MGWRIDLPSYETSYETPPCRNIEKIEHRTSNIERRILMALRFIEFSERRR
jgi:hypothetical protein